MTRGRWVVVGVVAVVALAVVGVAILPGIVRSRLESRIAGLTGRPTTIRDVDLNLFTRRLTVHGLEVRGEPGEPPLATLTRFETRFELLAYLARGAYLLDEARLVEPAVRIVRVAGDRLNVSELLDRLAAPDDEPPLELRIAHATISDGWIAFEDRVVSPSVSAAADALNAELASLSTEPGDRPGSVAAAFRLAGAPGSLRATDVSLRPLRAAWALALRDLPLTDAWAYIADDAALRPAGGRLTFRAAGTWTPDRGLQLDSDGTLTDLALIRRGQRDPWIMAPRLALVSRKVVYGDGGAHIGLVEVAGDATLVETGVSPPQRIPLRDAAVALAGAAIPGPAPGRLTVTAHLPGGGRLSAGGDLDVWPFAGHLQVTLADAPLALAAPHLPASAPLRIAGGRLDAALTLAMAADRVTVGGDLTGRDVALRGRGARSPLLQAAVLRATVEKLAIGDGAVALERLVASGAPTIVDPTTAPPQRYVVANARLTVARGRYPAGPPARVTFEAALDSGGRLTADGMARLGPATARLAVSATDLPLSRIDAYLPAHAPVRVIRGRLDAALDVRYDAAGGLRIDGTLEAEAPALRRRGQDEPLVADDHVRVAIGGLALAGGRVALARVSVEGSPTVVDATASPPQRVVLRRFAAEVRDAAWPSQAPARITAQAESVRGAVSTVEGRIDVATLATEARVEVAGVGADRLDAYLPAASPVRLGGGRLTAVVDFTHSGAEQRLDARGRITDLALALRGETTPFLAAPETAFTVDELTIRDGAVRVARAAVEGEPTTVALAGFGLGGGRVPFARSAAVVEDLALPDGGAAAVRLGAALPGTGGLRARGALAPGARRMDLAIDVDGAALDALGELVPTTGGLHGRIDAALRLAATLDDPVAVTVTGEVSAEDLSLSGADGTPLTASRVRVGGLEARWPPALAVAELTLEQPTALIERAPDGSFPLRSLLAPPAADGDAVAASPRTARGPAPAEAAPAGGRVPVEIGRLTIDGGAVRFIDRTVTPVYSEEIARLSVAAQGISTDADRVADVTVHGLVGGSAALELRGEAAPFGEPFYLDVSGTLRDFPAARTNPYVQHFTAWVIEGGEVRTDLHYRIVGDELEATNRLEVDQLSVERAEPEARVDIPLGLIVALLKDAGGDIRLTVPVRGRIDDPQFDFGQALARAFRNVLTRLVTTPLRAIASIFRAPEDGAVVRVEVEPVPFEAGSAALTPEARRHLHQVADALRASPRVGLHLTAPVTDADLAALGTQEILARVQQRQRETDASFDQAAATLFARAFPERPVPGDTGAVIAALAETAPPSATAARTLAERRLAVTRETLVEAAGVAPERLGSGPEPVPVAAGGAPRVDLDLVPEDGSAPDADAGIPSPDERR